jgi:hypothetical protein
MKGFPSGFKPQKLPSSLIDGISDLSGEELVEYFRAHRSVAEALLTSTYDKRFTPSTFIAEDGDGFRVGWYANGYLDEQRFTNLAEAATDYLLFSLGRGRSFSATSTNE